MPSPSLTLARSAARAVARRRGNAAGARAYRRFLLLVPLERGGWLGRSDDWLFDAANATGLSARDVTDAVWAGKVAHEFAAALEPAP